MWTKEQLRWLRFGGWALLGLVTLMFLWRLRAIFPIFLFGFFIAYLVDPLVDKLEMRGYSRGRAVTLVSLVFLLSTLILAVIVGPVIYREGLDLVNKSMPDGEIYQFVEDKYNKIAERVQGGDVPAFVKEKGQIAAEQFGNLLLKKITGVFTSPLGILNLILLPFITFYFLLNFDPFVRRLRRLVPDQYREGVRLFVGETGNLVGRYIRGYMVMCVCVGMISTLSMFFFHIIFGVQYWLVIGVLAGLTYAIPLFGGAVTLILAGIVSYVTVEPGQRVLCLVLAPTVLIAINMFFDYVITPKVIGTRIGLSPLLVIFSVMAGGMMFGVIGMFVASPIVGSIRLLLIRLLPQFFEETLSVQKTHTENFADGVLSSDCDG